MIKVALDAGHGGKDSGAQGYNLQEKMVTLAIVHHIANILQREYDGVEILLTRATDVFIELSERANIANRWGADYFLSVHVNAGAGTGFESHIYNGNVDSATVAYQNTLHAEIYRTAYQGFPDRGKKRSNFAVVRETNMPAILTENLFIDNSMDANYLNNPEKIELIARGHVNGLAKAFGIKAKVVPVAPVVGDPPFEDVPLDHWAIEDITWVKAQGLMNGYDGFFAPNAPLTRAEMASILRRLYKK